MATPKTWKVGIADEAWKVVICGRDVAEIDRLLSSLTYYLTNAGNDTEKGLSAIREMTGAEIVTALENYKRVAALSVQKALSKSNT